MLITIINVLIIIFLLIVIILCITLIKYFGCRIYPYPVKKKKLFDFKKKEKPKKVTNEDLAELVKDNNLITWERFEYETRHIIKTVFDEVHYIHKQCIQNEGRIQSIEQKLDSVLVKDTDISEE